MWMSTEDARSDVILAGATAVFGTAVLNLVARLPFYPRDGIAGDLLRLVWLFALTGLVPYLLTRYRKLGPESYGFETGRAGWSQGLLLAVPIVIAGVLRGLPVRGSVMHALLGRLSPRTAGDPTIVDPGGAGANLLADGVIAVALVALLAVGALLLYGFLTVRGRDAFAQRDLSATEAIRTFGLIAVGSALVFGLLEAIGPTLSVVGVLINVAALLALVLLGDRLVPHGAGTVRAAVLTPVIVAFLAHVLLLFRDDLLFALYSASLAAGMVVVLASIIEGRAYAWAIVAPIVATAIYPTCLSTLPYATSPFGC